MGGTILKSTNSVNQTGKHIQSYRSVHAIFTKHLLLLYASVGNVYVLKKKGYFKFHQEALSKVSQFGYQNKNGCFGNMKIKYVMVTYQNRFSDYD